MQRKLPWLFFILFLVIPQLFVNADTVSDQRAALQAQLDQINAQIQSNQGDLAKKQQQRTSLERDVAILDSKIQAAQLGIKARDLTLRQLKNSVGDKERGISSLDAKVVAGHASVGQMLRETRTIDNISLVEIALGTSLSDLMKEIDDFGTIQRALGKSFNDLALVRSDLAARKQALEDQQMILTVNP